MSEPTIPTDPGGALLSAADVAAMHDRIGLAGFTELAASIDSLVAQDARWRALVGSTLEPVVILLEQLRCIVEEEDWGTRAISLATALEAWHYEPEMPAEAFRDRTQALLTTLRTLDAAITQAQAARDGGA